MRGKKRDRAPKLKILHATDNLFRHVLSYKTWNLKRSSQLYIGKMATRTGKYSKRIKTPMTK